MYRSVGRPLCQSTTACERGYGFDRRPYLHAHPQQHRYAASSSPEQLSVWCVCPPTALLHLRQSPSVAPRAVACVLGGEGGGAVRRVGSTPSTLFARGRATRIPLSFSRLFFLRSSGCCRCPSTGAGCCCTSRGRASSTTFARVRVGKDGEIRAAQTLARCRVSDAGDGGLETFVNSRCLPV